MKEVSVRDAKEMICPFINEYCKADNCTAWDTTVYQEKQITKGYKETTKYLSTEDRKGICLRLSNGD